MISQNNNTFKTIITALRPQKIVSFIDSNETDWIDICSNIIDFYSQCWGGSYNLIIPTDGIEIDETFLEILKIFDPDYLYIYEKSYLDIKLSHPEKYMEILDKIYNKNYKKIGISKKIFLKEFKNQAINNSITPFQINSRTKNEILKYVNPFGEEFNYISADTIVEYPLTHIIDILFSTQSVGLIEAYINKNKIFNLLCLSKLGSARWIENIKESNFYENLEKKNFYNNFKICKTIKEVTENQFSEFLESIILNNVLIENHKINPFKATMINLGTFRPLEYISSQDPIVIVIGNTIKDFCLYYNISRLKNDVFWVPFNSQKNKKLDTFLSNLSKIIIKKFSSRSNKIIFFISKSISLRDLKKIIKIYEMNEFIKTNIRKEVVYNNLTKILPYIFKIYELNNYKNVYVEQFSSNKSVNFINTPLPRAEHFKLNKIDTLTFRWVNDLSIGLKKGGNSDSRYILPKKNIFSSYLFDTNADSTESELVRVTNEGFSYIGPLLSIGATRDYVENVISKLKIKLLESIDIFQIIFNSINLKIEFSDKGIYLNEFIKKFDQLKEVVRLLSNTKIFNLFKLFIKPSQKKEEEVPGIFLSSDRRRYLRFEDIKRILGKDSQNIIDTFIDKEVIHRGFIFKCSRCRNTDWYAINEIDKYFVCKRCSNKEKYTINNWSLKYSSNEPKWYYKLDEVIYQGFINHMESTIFTLFKIFNNTKKSFIYVPEINIYKGDTSENLEVDICCISDGEIFIGECTIENRLGKNKEEELKKLKHLKYIANNIGAKKIIISTLQNSLTSDLKNSIKKIIPNDIILYTKKDLLENIK